MSAKDKRIAILSSDDWHHKYLITTFSKAFDVVQIIIEPANSQRNQLLKNKKYLDFFYSKYHYYRRKILGMDSYRRLFFKCDYSSENYPAEVVDNINSEVVYDLLLKAKPDIIVVICTTILKQKLLNILQGGIINIHGGYLPYYRGNHCFFFAFYKNDITRIGSTIHFIDTGIDTGDIIEHVVPVIDESDFPESLYCKAEKMAIHRLVEILSKITHADEIPRKQQDFKFPLYRTRDRGPFIDLIYYFKAFKKKYLLF